MKHPHEKLQEEMAKLGNGISSMDLANCLQRAGLVLLGGEQAKRYEDYSWETSPDRMGS